MDKVSSNPLQPRHRSPPENFQINEAIFFGIMSPHQRAPPSGLLGDVGGGDHFSWPRSYPLAALKHRVFRVEKQFVRRSKSMITFAHIHTNFNKWVVSGFIPVRGAAVGEGVCGSAALSPLTFDINVFVGGLRPGSKQVIHPLNPPLVFVQTGMQFNHPSVLFPHCPVSSSSFLFHLPSPPLCPTASLCRTCSTWVKRERIRVTPLRGRAVHTL